MPANDDSILLYVVQYKQYKKGPHGTITNGTIMIRSKKSSPPALLPLFVFVERGIQTW
jgi:hypothetical protein